MVATRPERPAADYDEREAARIADGPAAAGDPDLPLLQRRAQPVENFPTVEPELVEEEHAVVPDGS